MFFTRVLDIVALFLLIFWIDVECDSFWVLGIRGRLTLFDIFNKMKILEIFILVCVQLVQIPYFIFYWKMFASSFIKISVALTILLCSVGIYVLRKELSVIRMRIVCVT